MQIEHRPSFCAAVLLLLVFRNMKYCRFSLIRKRIDHTHQGHTDFTVRPCILAELSCYGPKIISVLLNEYIHLHSPKRRFFEVINQKRCFLMRYRKGQVQFEKLLSLLSFHLITVSFSILLTSVALCCGFLKFWDWW